MKCSDVFLKNKIWNLFGSKIFKYAWIIKMFRYEIFSDLKFIEGWKMFRFENFQICLDMKNVKIWNLFRLRNVHIWNFQIGSDLKILNVVQIKTVQILRSMVNFQKPKTVWKPEKPDINSKLE